MRNCLPPRPFRLTTFPTTRAMTNWCWPAPSRSGPCASTTCEMGADAANLALTIHSHPTLSETVGLAAEAFDGTITDLYLPRKK